MDEFEYKLSRNNPVLITQAISKLVEIIKTKLANEPLEKTSENNELKYLKAKCLNDDFVVSLTANKGLVSLVNSGLLPLSSTLTELLSAISQTQIYYGLINSVCELLFLDLKTKLDAKDVYKCPFTLRSPQHPLLTILIQSPESSMYAFNQIQYLCRSNSNRVNTYLNEVLYPLHMFTFCDPDTKLPETFREQLWNFLILNNKHQSLNMIPVILGWMQISNKKYIMSNSKLLINMVYVQLKEESNETIEVLVLWLTSLLQETIEHNQDPLQVITCLLEIIERQKNLSCCSCVLMILSNCIMKCPSIYLVDLLRLCNGIILQNSSNNVALQTIRASLLHWMVYPCSLTADSLTIANKITQYIENNNFGSANSSKDLLSNKLLSDLKSSNEHVHFNIEFSIMMESFSEKNIINWLEKIKNIPHVFLKKLFNPLAGIFLCEFSDPKATVSVLKILHEISKIHKDITTFLLTLILHKLSNSVDPVVNLELLRMVPKMGVIKENLLFILNTLESIRKGPGHMKTFASSLYLDLWNIDVKCYPYLQNLLVAKYDKAFGSRWEFYITKAHVLKEICLKRPELYGSELVGHLSDILNCCATPDGDIASALALQGITALCKSGIVDIFSTWSELGPRFQKDTRIVVIESLCNLMAEISHFVTPTESNKLVDDVINRLWHYVTYSESIEIISAAYQALGYYTLEQISAQLPNIYAEILQEEAVETKFCDGFNHVPGTCWIKFLQNSNHAAMSAAGDLLIKMMSEEISAYRSGTYTVNESHGEPTNFNYLPVYSVVRGLGNFVKQQVEKGHSVVNERVLVECLRVLSQEYTKPLPPLDWCFLQELVHDRELKLYCVSLASHQVQLSGTARRFMENYIIALTKTANNDEDVLNIYKNLKFLCNSIQPVILQPFIDTSIALALQEKLNEQTNERLLFDEIVTHLKNTLNNESVHEAYRSVLSEVIIHTAKQMKADCTVFNKFLECIVVLPKKYIKDLCTPSTWSSTNEEVKLSVKVKCALALNSPEQSLTWLNDSIEATNLIASEYNYVLTQMGKVMEEFRVSLFCGDWILELLCRISATLVADKSNEKYLLFLCDLLILSVIVLSGHDILTTSLNDILASPEVKLKLFPQSTVQLLQNECMTSCTTQMLEWLFHMINCDNIPVYYKTTFYQSLTALRHEKEFMESSVWMKYVGSTIPLDL